MTIIVSFIAILRYIFHNWYIKSVAGVYHVLDPESIFKKCLCGEFAEEILERESSTRDVEFWKIPPTELEEGYIWCEKCKSAI